ncbi:hypothetical protein PABG_12127 [Paracoccidioides brasiliensis Pb03]|nr:hypothetical protein PABG_12127 [Paracoccidioides brasiliensis Pb03]
MALRLFAIGSYAAGEEDLAPQLISLHGTRTGGHIRRVQELFFYISDVSSSVKPLNATCLETRGWHGWDTMEETWAAGIWPPDAPVFPTSSQSELRNNMWNVDSFIVVLGRVRCQANNTKTDRNAFALEVLKSIVDLHFAKLF